MGVLNFTSKQFQKLIKNERLRAKLTPKNVIGFLTLAALLRFAIKNDLHYMVLNILTSWFDKEKGEIVFERNSIWGPK